LICFDGTFLISLIEDISCDHVRSNPTELQADRAITNLSDEHQCQALVECLLVQSPAKLQLSAPLPSDACWKGYQGCRGRVHRASCIPHRCIRAAQVNSTALAAAKTCCQSGGCSRSTSTRLFMHECAGSKRTTAYRRRRGCVTY
jgi:hypothetical protein